MHTSFSRSRARAFPYVLLILLVLLLGAFGSLTPSAHALPMNTTITSLDSDFLSRNPSAAGAYTLNNSISNSIFGVNGGNFNNILANSSNGISCANSAQGLISGQTNGQFKNATLNNTRYTVNMSTIFPSGSTFKTVYNSPTWTQLDKFLDTIQYAVHTCTNQTTVNPTFVLGYNVSYLENCPTEYGDSCTGGSNDAWGCNAFAASPTQTDWTTPTDLVTTDSTDAIGGTVNEGPAEWAQLAKKVADHILNYLYSAVGTKVTGIKTNFEIWNEPDGAFLGCSSQQYASPASAAQKLQMSNAQLRDYTSIFEATAPVLDNLVNTTYSSSKASISIGGPALAGVGNAENVNWMPQLLGDPGVYNYLDFVSYHNYVDLPLSDCWTSCTHQILNDSLNSSTGVAAQYQYIDSQVQNAYSNEYGNTAGLGHNTGAPLPIVVSEYNASTKLSGNGPDCCRTDNTYGPLFNTLWTQQMLSAPYDATSQAAAKQQVAFMTTFQAGESGTIANGANGNFCMFGTLPNTENTSSAPDGYCQYSNGVSPQELGYPNYYAYWFMGDSRYGDMNDSTLSVTTGTPTNGSIGNSGQDLEILSYYVGDCNSNATCTSNAFNQRDVLLLVNTSATAYDISAINFKNAGPQKLSSTGAGGYQNAGYYPSEKQVTLLGGGPPTINPTTHACGVSCMAAYPAGTYQTGSQTGWTYTPQTTLTVAAHSSELIMLY